MPSKSYIAKKTLELKSEQEVTAFTDVNVVPMDSEKVLKAQTVIVRSGVIESINDSIGANVPADALVIDGEGKYLLPGLADMHAHVAEENDLLLFLASGVTTVRNMFGQTGVVLLMGFSDQKELRDRINNDTLLGPTIYTAGPVLDGEPLAQPFMARIRTAKEAIKAVVDQHKNGYDFIKVYDNLSIESYDAILLEARKHDMPVAGHVPIEVGLDKVLESGQVSIEHLTGYLDPDAA